MEIARRESGGGPVRLGALTGTGDAATVTGFAIDHRKVAPGTVFGAFQGTRVNGEDRSEEHTSELQSLMRISYAVFCLKKKKTKTTNTMRDTVIFIDKYIAVILNNEKKSNKRHL